MHVPADLLLGYCILTSADAAALRCCYDYRCCTYVILPPRSSSLPTVVGRAPCLLLLLLLHVLLLFCCGCCCATSYMVRTIFCRAYAALDRVAASASIRCAGRVGTYTCLRAIIVRSKTQIHYGLNMFAWLGLNAILPHIAKTIANDAYSMHSVITRLSLLIELQGSMTQLGGDTGRNPW